MTIRLLQVDTFTDRVLGGNPAAVCPLDTWLDEATMQAIAAENNLSETAFLVAEGKGYRLRWFTPNVEVDLCGHATLAAAYVVFEELEPGTESVSFETLSGRLTVAQEDDALVMDFPAQPASPATPPPALAQALGAAPAEVLAGVDWIAVFENAAQVAALSPDHAMLTTLDRRGVVATAPGDEGDADYVLRFFAPKNAVPEDPVTGNVQTALVPYWAGRLGKRRLAVRQLSARGGRMVCEDRGERVSIAGRAMLYMDATIFGRPLTGAVDAAGDGRVDGEPLGGNSLPAIGAVTVVAGIQTAQRRLDERQPRAATRFHRLRHRLHLHGVHARDAADALLIERDRAPLFRRCLAQRKQLGALLLEALPDRRGIARSAGGHGRCGLIGKAIVDDRQRHARATCSVWQFQARFRATLDALARPAAPFKPRRCEDQREDRHATRRSDRAVSI